MQSDSDLEFEEKVWYLWWEGYTEGICAVTEQLKLGKCRHRVHFWCRMWQRLCLNYMQWNDFYVM